jgi:Predicted amidophosphoribosyltransferases
MGNGIVKNLKFIWDCILQVIYPTDEKCILCGEDIKEDNLICTECEGNIRFCEDVFTIEQDNTKFKYYSISYYAGNMMELILRLKYKSDFRAGEAIARYMVNIIKSKDIQFDFISYVPMTKISMKKRGYNQSEYLARIIGGETNKPVIRCLEKIKQTKDQIGLNRVERWDNVINSFKTVNKNIIINKKILLVDDVITTGATAFSCAYELLKCDAGEITILTGAKSRV